MKEWSTLRITARTYKMYLLLQLLRANEQHASRDSYLALSTLTKRLDRGISWLEQVVPPLVAAEVLRARRGPGGGYRLGPRAEKLTMLELVQLAERCEPRSTDPLGAYLLECMRHDLVFQEVPTH